MSPVAVHLAASVPCVHAARPCHSCSCFPVALKACHSQLLRHCRAHLELKCSVVHRIGRVHAVRCQPGGSRRTCALHPAPPAPADSHMTAVSLCINTNPKSLALNGQHVPGCPAPSCIVPGTFAVRTSPSMAASFISVLSVLLFRCDDIAAAGDLWSEGLCAIICACSV